MLPMKTFTVKSRHSKVNVRVNVLNRKLSYLDVLRIQTIGSSCLSLPAAISIVEGKSPDDDIGALTQLPQRRNDPSVDCRLMLRCFIRRFCHRRPWSADSFRCLQQSGSKAALSPSSSATGLVREPRRSLRNHDIRLTTCTL